MEQEDSGGEYQRLARLYSEKWDGELRELAASYDDLTESARQALREEMMKRGLGDPAAPLSSVQPDPVPTASADAPGDELELEPEYTWKTPLCDCTSHEQVWQLTEVLRRAGIESWIEGGNRYTWDGAPPRLLVAADQLDRARTLASQPIPQDVIDEWNQQQSEDAAYKIPTCPVCGAPDPILASVDPVNTWQCETCGHEWSDPAPSSPEN